MNKIIDIAESNPILNIMCGITWVVMYIILDIISDFSISEFVINFNSK